MRFLIEIAGDDQPALIRSLDKAREYLVEGRTRGGQGGYFDFSVKPADERTEADFNAQYAAAHPKPTAPWMKEPCKP